MEGEQEGEGGGAGDRQIVTVKRADRQTDRQTERRTDGLGCLRRNRERIETLGVGPGGARRGGAGQQPLYF